MGARRKGFESASMDDHFRLETVEIIRRPGQTLGFYIREGNGLDRLDGVFISRIATGSVVETNKLLRVFDEILAVDQVDVTRMSLDDVAILMSIPKRLVLTIRTRKICPKNLSCPSLSNYEAEMSVPLSARQPHLQAPRNNTSSSSPYSPYSSFPSTDDSSRQQQQPGYLRKDKAAAASVGDITDPEASEADAGHQQFRTYGTTNPGFRKSLDVARSLSQRPSSYEIEAVTQRRLTDSLSSTRERAVDILEELLGQRQSRRNHVISRWSNNRKSSVDSPGRSGSQRRRVEYSSDTDAQCSAQEQTIRSGVQSTFGGRSLTSTRENSPERNTSDSETYVLNKGLGDRSRLATFARHSSYLNQLIGRDDRYATLPQRLQSAVSSQELKHWLQKLDNLAYELESQQLAADNVTPPTGTKTNESGCGHRVRAQSASSAEIDCYTAHEYRTWTGRQTPSPSLSPSFSSTDYHPPLSVSPSPSSSSSISSPRQISSVAAVTRKMLANSVVGLCEFRRETPDGQNHRRLHSSSTTSSSSSSSTQTWRGNRRSPSSTSSSKSNASFTVCPRYRLGDPSFQQISSKLVADRLAASSILKDLSMAKKPSALRTDDFIPYPPAHTQALGHHSNILDRRTDLGPCDGSVYVHILCGHGLKTQRTMLRDLYCVLAVDSVNKARTMIRTGAINFDWNEDFEVDIIAARRMSFLIYSWDPTTKHTLCFSASMSLQSCFRHSSPPSGHRLLRLALKLDPKGILYVELICRDPATVFQRLPVSDPSAIFGVALETIVRREAAADNIPLVIKRCVVEIESRGLSHVGLYRLCGSARRKDQLKADLTSNISGTELSPQAVSDINVITSVVKDFLLQLPEPVFTAALYQMLLDAISVRIPEDPDGNSKLMFSVIECLPKVNQDFVSFLLNHLKRIISKKDANKMDATSLSDCFGPMMLCPPFDPDTKQALDFRKQAEVLRYVLDIWPNGQDQTQYPQGGSFERPRRSSNSVQSDLIPQKPQDSNSFTSGSGGDSDRASTMALIHAAPDKTSFC